MKALLLAAGRGTRLGEHTRATPKCMLPVGGRPLVEHTIDWLRDQGVVELALNLHHAPEVVVEHFGDGGGHGVHIRYSREPELLGTAGALVPLASWLGDDTFLLVYADNLIKLDLERLDELHRKLQAAVTVALFHRSDVSSSGVALVDDDGRVQRFLEKPQHDVPSNWVSAGLLLCEPRMLDFVPRTAPADIGADVLPALLEAGETVAGYRMGPFETLHWIDTPADLAAVAAMLEPHGDTHGDIAEAGIA